MTVEIWKPIPGYENYYEASNFGNIRALKREYIRRDGLKKTYRQQIRKQQKTLFGYLKVDLSKAGTTKTYTVHRLVALAHLHNPSKKGYVNHRNGIKTDNRLENLEWATKSEDVQHAWDTGLRKRSGFKNCENNPNAKLSNNQVDQIRYQLKNSKLTQQEIADFHGISRSVISGIKCGKIWASLDDRHLSES